MIYTVFMDKMAPGILRLSVMDNDLDLFEGQYPVPQGVSYNSYLIEDDQLCLLDTVDARKQEEWLAGLDEVLAGRKLDYLVISHMEPDHAGSIAALCARQPQLKLVANARTFVILDQFSGDAPLAQERVTVADGGALALGSHTLHFVLAPMVHWPEVMVSYDMTDKILFSADAFGAFGALNGALFADEVDFMRDYMDEARRYYTNIVGKYGTQVQALLKKAAGLEIETICPLHGFVWRKNLGDFIEKYRKWSLYEPEETGVMIAYASVYGNTANAADILACRLRELGVKTVMYDVSVTPASDIIAAAFKWSHLVFASTTYNAGIFVTMEALINDLAAHNIQNRTVGIIENGTWAATSGGLIRTALEKCKNMTFVGDKVSIKSSVKTETLEGIFALADGIAATMPKPAAPVRPAAGNVDASALFRLSYGLFVLTAREGERDNGCIINTVMQVTDSPKRISIAVNKANLTHDMIESTGVFNLSVLTTETPLGVFEQFGFTSGRNTDKFAGCGTESRTANGVRYAGEYANAVISGHVVEKIDCGTHTLFIADVTEAAVLSDAASMTYQYYFDHVKPKPQPVPEKKKGFVCKICGYVYEGEELSADFVCPLCKHGAEDFERL